MEQIIEKLNQMEETQDYNDDPWNGWSLEEKKRLLDIYLVISKKEDKIYDLIYSLHGCDSWEDIFRDYNGRKMDDKTEGVVIAVDEITKQIANEREEEENEDEETQ
jgi:hypothetical protein